MRRVILLRGSPEQGKTTAIKGLLKKLLLTMREDARLILRVKDGAIGFAEFMGTSPDDFGGDGRCAPFEIIFRHGDIRLIVKVNDKTIGFDSRGDPYQGAPAEKISFFEEENCDICITACRTKGDTKDAIVKWVKDKGHGASHFKINEQKGCVSIVEKMFSTLEKYLNEQR